MATPKKKVSRSRRNMRRFAGGNRLDKPTAITCPACSEPTRPHSICACGQYKGKQVLAPRTRATEPATA